MVGVLFWLVSMVNVSRVGCFYSMLVRLLVSVNFLKLKDEIGLLCLL